MATLRLLRMLTLAELKMTLMPFFHIWPEGTSYINGLFTSNIWTLDLRCYVLFKIYKIYFIKGSAYFPPGSHL